MLKISWFRARVHINDWFAFSHNLSIILKNTEACALSVRNGTLFNLFALNSRLDMLQTVK